VDTETEANKGGDEGDLKRRTRKTNAYGPSTTRSSQHKAEVVTAASRSNKKEVHKETPAKTGTKKTVAKKSSSPKSGPAKKTSKEAQKSKIRKPVLPLVRKGTDEDDAMHNDDNDPKPTGVVKSYSGPRGLISKRQKVKPEAVFVVNKTKPSDRPNEYIDDPGSKDILLGDSAVTHDGNEEFLEKVAEAAAVYMAIDRKQCKAQFIENFISNIIVRGFRFLRFDADLRRWYVVISPIRDRHVRSRIRSELSGTEPDPATEHMTEGVEIMPDDILLGKSAMCYNHPGNMVFRDKIASCSPEFTKIDVKRDKVKYIDNLIKFFINEGSRFLRLDPETQGWCVVSDSSKVVREKCTHALREPMYDRFKNSTRTSTKLGAVTKMKALKRKKQALAKEQALAQEQALAKETIAERKNIPPKPDSDTVNPSELSAAQILVCLESMVSDNSESNGDDEKPGLPVMPNGEVLSAAAIEESQIKDLECNEDLPCDADSDDESR